MSDRPDAVIIGAGVVGLCTAHFLAEKGARVVIFDKGGIGAGSSSGNAGMLVPSHFVPLAAPGVWRQAVKWMFRPDSPFYLRPRWDRELARWLFLFQKHCNRDHVRRSMPVLREITAAGLMEIKKLVHGLGLECEFREAGLMFVYNSERGRQEAEEVCRLASEVGVQADRLDGAAVAEKAQVTSCRATAGVYFPGDAHFHPAKFLHELGENLLRRPNVELRLDEITQLESNNGAVAVQTASGEKFLPQAVVVAAGAWSARLTRCIGWMLPLQPAKGYSMTFDGAPFPGKIPMILEEARVAVTPFEQQIRYGGTLELSGFDERLNLRRMQAILDAVPSYFPGVQPNYVDAVEHWAGFRPATPDGLPVIGRVPDCSNLFVATGHGMLGMTLGAITGRAVANLVSGEPAGMDLQPFRIDRF